EGVKISIDLMPLEIPLTITVNETFDYTYVQPVLRPSDEKTISMTALLESVYGFGEDTGKEDFNFYVYSISQRCDNYRCASAEVTQLRNVLTRQEIGWLSKYFRKQFQN
ncbi:MAG: hypothetical protein Q8P95_01110, partial [bacterium]|nr:hypothetical protein [bacterium]